MTRLFLGALAIAALGTGCMTRNLRSVQDVAGTADTTLLETTDVMNLYLYVQVKHVFWQCREQALTLTCEKACDGTTDLQCPTGVGMVVSRASNVR